MNKTGVLEGWKRALLIIVPYFFGAGLFALLGSIVVGADYTNNIPPTLFQTLIIDLFHLFGTILVVSFFLKFIDKESFTDLGLKKAHKFTGFFLGTILGLIEVV